MDSVNPVRVLHLFSGAGGGILGSILLGHKIVGAVEIDRDRRKVLLARQQDGCLPTFPIHKDVRKFDGKPWKGQVDVICGGFPCQPWSHAGLRRGKNDDRNLWPDTLRIIREVGPRIAFLENVPGLLSFPYFGRILGGLAEAGYDAEWEVVSASSIGAPHKRKRLWILAHTHTDRSGLLSDHSVRGKGSIEEQEKKFPSVSRFNSPLWSPLPRPIFWRSIDGMAKRLGRRWAALGDGQVPQVAAAAFLMLYQRAVSD